MFGSRQTLDIAFKKNPPRRFLLFSHSLHRNVLQINVKRSGSMPVHGIDCAVITVQILRRVAFYILITLIWSSSVLHNLNLGHTASSLCFKCCRISSSSRLEEWGSAPSGSIKIYLLLCIPEGCTEFTQLPV